MRSSFRSTLQKKNAHSSILNQCRELLIHHTGSRLCCGEVPSLIAVLSSKKERRTRRHISTDVYHGIARAWF